MLRWRRLFWLAHWQEAGDETRSRDVVDARPKQAYPGSFSGSGERLLSPFCVWGTGTPVEGTGSLMHSRSQGAKKVGGGWGTLCAWELEWRAALCSRMQSHAQPKPGGQSHKGGDSEFGTLRAWVGTAHSSGGGDAHTDFKLEDTGRFCPTVTSVVLHLQRFNFGPTLAPLTRMIDGQRTRTPRVGIVLPLSQSPHCSAHDRPHTTK
jgi:hypothetical protein